MSKGRRNEVRFLSHQCMKEIKKNLVSTENADIIYIVCKQVIL